MLETISWFGVLFLLLITGFEVSVSSVWKQGRASLTIGVIGVLIPIIMVCLIFYWFPSEFWGANANRHTFTLFLSTAAAISAIPVIAKILHDLDILKSDFGLTTLSAFVVNDILGWLIFTMVLGLAASQTQADALNPLRVFFEIVLFGTVCLTVGSRMVGGITKWLKKSSLPQTATILTFITCLGMLCGAITQWIGIHAILGFFLAGIMAGNTPEISEKTRSIISQMVHAIFVPIFFVSIGIKIDFISHFHPLLIVIFTFVAVFGKFVGAWFGGFAARLSKQDAFSIGIAHIPGGAMEIVIGMLALELKLIPENVFVAVVFAAVSSSVVVGPLLAWSIKKRKFIDIGQFVLEKAIILNLRGSTKWEVIFELSESLAEQNPHLDGEMLSAEVIHREKMMGTGLEKGIAIPHARIEGIEKPLIAFGFSKPGIDWDARDGVLSRFVFLVLTPENDEGIQVQILAAIARFMMLPNIMTRIANQQDPHKVYAMLKQGLRLQK